MISRASRPKSSINFRSPTSKYSSTSSILSSKESGEGSPSSTASSNLSPLPYAQIAREIFASRGYSVGAFSQSTENSNIKKGSGDNSANQAPNSRPGGSIGRKRSTDDQTTTRIPITTETNIKNKKEENNDDEKDVDSQDLTVDLNNSNPPNLVFEVLRSQLKRLKRAKQALKKNQENWQHEKEISFTLSKNHELKFFSSTANEFSKMLQTSTSLAPHALSKMSHSEQMNYLGEDVAKILSVNKDNDIMKLESGDAILQRLQVRRRVQLSVDAVDFYVKELSHNIETLKSGILSYPNWGITKRIEYLNEIREQLSKPKACEHCSVPRKLFEIMNSKNSNNNTRARPQNFQKIQKGNSSALFEPSLLLKAAQPQQSDSEKQEGSEFMSFFSRSKSIPALDTQLFSSNDSKSKPPNKPNAKKKESSLDSYEYQSDPFHLKKKKSLENVEISEESNYPNENNNDGNNTKVFESYMKSKENEETDDGAILCEKCGCVCYCCEEHMELDKKEHDKICSFYAELRHSLLPVFLNFSKNDNSDNTSAISFENNSQEMQQTIETDFKTMDFDQIAGQIKDKISTIFKDHEEFSSERGKIESELEGWCQEYAEIAEKKKKQAEMYKSTKGGGKTQRNPDDDDEGDVEKMLLKDRLTKLNEYLQVATMERKTFIKQITESLIKSKEDGYTNPSRFLASNLPQSDFTTTSSIIHMITELKMRLNSKENEIIQLKQQRADDKLVFDQKEKELRDKLYQGKSIIEKLKDEYEKMKEKCENLQSRSAFGFGSPAPAPQSSLQAPIVDGYSILTSGSMRTALSPSNFGAGTSINFGSKNNNNLGASAFITSETQSIGIQTDEPVEKSILINWKRRLQHVKKEVNDIRDFQKDIFEKSMEKYFKSMASNLMNLSTNIEKRESLIQNVASSNKPLSARVGNEDVKPSRPQIATTKGKKKVLKKTVSKPKQAASILSPIPSPNHGTSNFKGFFLDNNQNQQQQNSNRMMMRSDSSETENTTQTKPSVLSSNDINNSSQRSLYSNNGTEIEPPRENFLLGAKSMSSGNVSEVDENESLEGEGQVLFRVEKIQLGEKKTKNII